MDNENNEVLESVAGNAKAIPPIRICLICASDMVYNHTDGLWHCSNPDCWWVDAD